MLVNCSTSTAPFLWPGMPGTPEATERTEPVLYRSGHSESCAQNCFGVVSRNPPTFRFGPFGLVGTTDRLRTDNEK